MAVRYQCDRCGRLSDDARDFKHVRIEPARAAVCGGKAVVLDFGSQGVREAELCHECAQMLMGFIEGVC